MHPNPTSPALDRFKRDPEAPPCDSLAEATVLRTLLYQPSLIGTVDLAPLLVLPEHRSLWQAMLRVPPALRTDPMGFLSAWAHDLCARHCGQRDHHEFWTVSCTALLMWHSLCGARQAEDEWVEDQYELTREDDPRMSRHFHGWEWWLARIKACAEARQIISAAQEMAERAWRVPDDEFGAAEAQATIARVRPLTRSRFTLEIPG